MPWIPALVACVLALSGCEKFGLETPEMSRERAVSDGQAIGAACRHAMRAIEDCYVLNPSAEKASVFAGWKDMDSYMRENSLEGVTPILPRELPPKPASAASDVSQPGSKDMVEDEYEYEDDLPPPRRGSRSNER